MIPRAMRKEKKNDLGFLMVMAMIMRNTKSFVLTTLEHGTWCKVDLEQHLVFFYGENC
jgi:hypothetical protein